MENRQRELVRSLKVFVSEHRDGWNHDEWLDLLRDLGIRGFDVSDDDGIGLALEKQRVMAELEKHQITGLGPKRREALADHVGTLWNLRHASPEQIAEGSAIPRTVAQRVLDAIR